MRELLQIQGLRAGYSNKPIIDVDLEVKEGEFVALVGQNGSGKTTLLRAILRMIPIFSGEVLLGGQSIFSLSRRQIARQIAYLPQENGQDFPFSLEEVVLMGRFPHNPILPESAYDREKAREALKKVALSEKSGQRFDTLSGGEKRRAAIARALAQESSFLLLDEPTSHLDLKYQLEISQLLRQLAEEGKAILAVYHDIWLVSSFAHRILAMKEGKIFGEFLSEEITPSLIAKIYDLGRDYARFLTPFV